MEIVIYKMSIKNIQAFFGRSVAKNKIKPGRKMSGINIRVIACKIQINDFRGLHDEGKRRSVFDKGLSV